MMLKRRVMQGLLALFVITETVGAMVVTANMDAKAADTPKPFIKSDISCSSDYVIQKLTDQVTDDASLWLMKIDTLKKIAVDKDAITTLGTTYAGRVCDTNMNGFKDAEAKDDDDPDEYIEVYYRVDPGDNGNELWVEIISKDTAMVAK